jgi:hypothetical protein
MRDDGIPAPPQQTALALARSPPCDKAVRRLSSPVIWLSLVPSTSLLSSVDQYIRGCAAPSLEILQTVEDSRSVAYRNSEKVEIEIARNSASKPNCCFCLSDCIGCSVALYSMKRICSWTSRKRTTMTTFKAL